MMSLIDAICINNKIVENSIEMEISMKLLFLNINLKRRCENELIFKLKEQQVV